MLKLFKYTLIAYRSAQHDAAFAAKTYVGELWCLFLLLIPNPLFAADTAKITVKAQLIKSRTAGLYYYFIRNARCEREKPARLTQ